MENTTPYGVLSTLWNMSGDIRNPKGTTDCEKQQIQGKKKKGSQRSLGTINRILPSILSISFHIYGRSYRLIRKQILTTNAIWLGKR